MSILLTWTEFWQRTGYFCLHKSDYNRNLKIIADFETYNFDEKIKNHVVWIPVIEK